MLKPIVAPLVLAAAEGGGGGLLSVETTLLWSTIVLFVVFAWVLRRFAWGPLLKVIDDREKGIREQVAAAEGAAAEAKAVLVQHQEMLRGASREREEILVKTIKESDGLRTDLVAKARAEAEAMLARARDQIQRDKDAAVAELRNQVAEIAVAAAAKIVTSSLTPEVQRKLADDYIASLPTLTPERRA